ncbi:hypothetical protein R1flu_026684 [Riccia fluitans]|uniref:Uncharacterized protein n=1 Tax=Riccia fluitans TaxID=41844 RepID=A0ABD1XJN1_9MARC
MKRSGEDKGVKLVNQGCLLPLLRRGMSGSGRARRIKGDFEDEESELTQIIVTTPTREQSESQVHNKRKPPKRVTFREEVEISDPVSARLTLAKLVAILRDAYVCTMMSFGTKGGLGAVTMGGNINLQTAVAPIPVKRAIISS